MTLMSVELLGLALVGGVLGWLSLLLVRRLAPQGSDVERRIWALFLIVAALSYIVFAAVRGATPGWVLLECAGLLIYGALAAQGIRAWPGWVGLGWIGHMLWDAVPRLGHTDHVPTWYGPMCMGYDLVVGLSLLWPVLMKALKRK